jgi:phenylacetate-CoA ligase
VQAGGIAEGSFRPGQGGRLFLFEKEAFIMAMYWNDAIECMDVNQMKKIQDERLKSTVQRVYDNVPYYRDKMKKAGIGPQDIRGTEDIHKLPFTYKNDLRDNYPFGTFAVPLEDVVRVHASSGTTGKSTVVGYTRKDIDTWAECMARAFCNVGVTPKDIVHVAYGYGLFTGGLGAHYGAEKLGATVIPVSGGNTKRQIQLLKDFGATVLCCTPSYALYLADEMKEQNVSVSDLKLRVGVFGAEPWSEEMRQEVETRLGLKAYDIYGLSEIMGPGVSMDCKMKKGLHIPADHFIAEIINPETGEVLPEGEKGELVFTCISKEALPLIRYRTKDISSLHSEPCECGRTSPRMDKVTGRSDDMLIIRGVNVFPSQIESVLLQYGEVEPHYMIYVDRVGNLDEMEVQIEMTPAMFSDEVKKIEAVENRLRKDIESTLGINATVRLVEPKTIARSEGKAKRVEDRRKLFK